MIKANVKTIGIIGAGVAGLGACRLLRQAGFDCEIFERGATVGGVWASGYATFGLQTPKQLYEIPDYPIPASYPRVPSGEQLQTYFENYAKDYKFFDKIHFNTSISRLEQQQDGGWIVHTTAKDGSSAQKAFDFIVVATGLFSDPYIPEYPGREKFKGKVIHTSEYRNSDIVAGRNAVVVGFGKSALDVVAEVAKYAKKASLLYRKAHWPIPMNILDLIDVRRLYLTRLASSFLPHYHRPNKWATFLHKAPLLVSGFWRFTEAVIRIQYPLKKLGLVPKEKFEIDIFNLDFLPRKEVYKLMLNGKIKNHCGEIKEYTEKGVTLNNGENIEADVVIFGTGYKSNNYKFLPEAFAKTREADGVYLYRHIIHPDLNNLAFIGSAATFSNSLTSHLASVWLIKLLKGKFQLPDRAAMLKEIDEMKRWKRSFMPAISTRSTVINLHMWQYHDELLQDASINPYRKMFWALEWLDHYRPSDYRTALSEINNS